MGHKRIKLGLVALYVLEAMTLKKYKHVFKIYQQFALRQQSQGNPVAIVCCFVATHYNIHQKSFL